MDIEANRDQTALEIYNATTAKTKLAPVKEEGVAYVSSSGTYYSDPEVDAEKIIDLRKNIIVKGVLRKQINLIFQDNYSIEVKDAAGKIDEDLNLLFAQMCETKSVRLYANMKRAYKSIYYWGIAPYNPVWGVDKESTISTGDIRLLKLRHLPGETFKTAPAGAIDTYCPLLPGITADPKTGDMVFWQEPKKNDSPILLKNVFYIKDPSDDDFGGDPIIIPIIPVIEMIKFVLNKQMQQVNRIGAKILFIKVTNPQPASSRNGNVSDVEYANAIIKSWGSDTAFQLRENMELIDLKLTDESNNLVVFDYLNDMIIDYVSPSTFISTKQTTKLGGSDNTQKELLDNYIKGIHQMITEQFEMLLMRYFEYNQFEGYTVKIKLPPPSHSTREDNRKDADSGFLTQSLDVNEIRKLLGHDPKDESGLTDLATYYADLNKTEQLIRPVTNKEELESIKLEDPDTKPKRKPKSKK